MSPFVKRITASTRSKVPGSHDSYLGLVRGSCYDSPNPRRDVFRQNADPLHEPPREELVDEELGLLDLLHLAVP